MYKDPMFVFCTSNDSFESLLHKEYIRLSRGGRTLRLSPHCCVVSISFTYFVMLHSMVMTLLLQLLHNMLPK